jgi:ABC-2 type transport system permease protein
LNSTSETTQAEIPITVKRTGIRPLRLRSNPILQKEIRSRMRSLRTFILLTLFLGLISSSAAIVLTLLGFSTGQPGTLEIWQRSGQIIFYTVFIIELFLVSFIAPALTTGAIASEREHQTYDLLRTTLLSTPNLVLGKISAALVFLLLLILSTLPLYALAYTFGGVNFSEILIAAGILLWTAVLYTIIGLFFSSIIKRTLLATVVTYIVVGLLTIGIPVLLLSLLSVFIPVLSMQVSTPSIIAQIALFTIGWMIVSINPLTASIATEIARINNGSLWILELSLSDGSAYKLLSPWIPFIFFATLMITLFILLSIQIIRRPDR